MSLKTKELTANNKLIINEGERSKKEKKRSLIYTIAYYMKKEWHFSLAMFLIIIVLVGCSVTIPLIVQQITTNITHVVGTPYPDNYWNLSILQLSLIALGIILIYTPMCYFFDYVAYLLGRKVEIDLRNKTLEALVRQDISYYSNKKIGEILTKVISDTQIVGDQTVQIPLQLGVSFFEMIAAFVMMLVLAWQLALIVIGVFLIIMLVMFLSYALTKKRYDKVRQVVTEINGNVTDRVATIRLIKATGTEDYETTRFHEVHKEYYKKAKPIGRIQSFMLTSMWAGIFILQVAVVVGAGLIFKNKPDFFKDTFSAFLIAQSIMIGPLFQVMGVSFGLAQAAVAAKRVWTVIDSKPILNPHYSTGIKIDKIDGPISFKELEFAYPEKPEKTILPKFNFTFEEGKSYAFVGETGSGKSTIAKLLLRFYDPKSGSITINENHNLQDINLQSYLDHIGYVEQDPQILFGTVKENVKYGRFAATEEEVIAACKKADLHNLVMTWPQGYDTILGERGFMLSGGQKQRLVIARMFLKNPQVLILDEATSALDNIVEKEIQKQLEKLMKGRTTITIAHRLSTIKKADLIVVLGANGAGIVQTGKFEDLKKVPGHFKKLYEAGLME
ncbi:ATP-binding cassette subfamily B protein [Entomoplasma freundtii]|uniref:ABC transporter ATP-binding protein n=1 Tax=Entomoplasma freundtii TaxID=74700 RepID=A0A2K8NQM7_9MOLU|nr:ABC transporter ATP-binding protein [Entomoplasma freundtii]ATZ16142.1 ABC transporter ATP-binding protein [Entomoplasma freundtii]TDY56957.1 ATP-binding cassette subfamily B protein [Entomoplasma freundtii]